ncbi:hypothetical protein KP509_08G055400 [Ceratopteris richardii]|uniref:Uncharacterized protein n=4 Tax=Ceratopteris richardii TaxID=49495 RepID=A0A8T2UGJ4_CERRI|nr:hypothetical protein KP509_08G055400 [Ceratopteris richardii]KAH7431563.1 hypothetical protein KP509_08G055400 [Ceratopteris richardii]KAH7431564.1 hypothetical protein KP509_08G055400 [Ceratopteris richardii]
MVACSTMAAATVTTAAWVNPPLTSCLAFRIQCRPLAPYLSIQGRQGLFTVQNSQMLMLKQMSRRKPICAEMSDTEKAFKTTVELDKFIDELRYANEKELPMLVAKNVLAFDTPFWLRLAARADICGSNDEKKDYENLAASIMTVVEKVVRKTEEKIESSTGVLESILEPITQEDEEIIWPPRDLNGIVEMKKVLELKEKKGFLDEGFLSAVTAQIRQARESGDKPGLVAILQKVLQLYAAHILSKRSYAMKDGQVVKAEMFLETIISADEDSWETILRGGLVYGGGDVEPEDLFNVLKKRVERVNMRTESGSYQQRVLLEYLKEIEERAEAVVQAFKTSTI